MPIDPAGTAPGLTPEAPLQETVNLKCRKEKCESISAYVVKIPGQPQQRIYRCTTCNHTWGLNVGGAVNL